MKEIYNVLEKVLNHKRLGLRLTEKPKMAKLITGRNTKNETVQQQFTFINNQIHHNSDKHVFTEQEFIYWWLEMNNFIYIISNLSQE